MERKNNKFEDSKQNVDRSLSDIYTCFTIAWLVCQAGLCGASGLTVEVASIFVDGLAGLVVSSLDLRFLRISEKWMNIKNREMGQS